MHVRAVNTRVQQILADENGFFQIPFLLKLLRLTQRCSNLWATHARPPPDRRPSSIGLPRPEREPDISPQSPEEPLLPIL